MKKLSKKQKLICFIAILIVAVIIAIIITTNIIRNNSQVASEGYSATSANAGSSLISNYILNGITIGGITGKMDVLNTSDATATEEDILWGKTGYVKGKKITGTKIVTVAQGKESQKVFKENTTLIDDYGNNVKVPSGFKISSDSETAVTAGVVIEDVSAGNNYTKGSQFVWIPVGNVKTNNDGSMEQIELGRYNFDKTSGKSTIVQSAQNWNDTSNAVEKNGCKELESSTFGNTTAKNLEDFIKKVQTTLGFYIGRYEAGDAYATDSHRQSNSPKTNPVICSSSVYPYSYVTQPQAASLAQNMYNNENFESDLINSYVWDTTIVYIQKFSGDSNYSIQNGESDGNYKKCGSYILKNVDDGDEEKDVRCNIYDMAGSMQEFTTETSVDGKIKVRGGTMASNSSMYTSMYTGIQTINTAMHIVAFRPCLYL